MMFATAFSSISKAVWRPRQPVPVRPRPARRPVDVPYLRYLPLVDPLPARDAQHLPGAGVWISASLAPSGDAQHVFERHLALEALLLHVDLLGGHAGRASNPRLARLVDDRLTHVYIDSSDFMRMRGADAGEKPGADCPVAHVDESRQWLVIDVDRAFRGQGPFRVTAGLIAALVQLVEAPGLAMLPANSRMLEVARLLARCMLGETGLAFSEDSQNLAKRIGTQALVRWLLSGSTPQERAPLRASALGGSWRQARAGWGL